MGTVIVRIYIYVCMYYNIILIIDYALKTSIIIIITTNVITVFGTFIKIRVCMDKQCLINHPVQIYESLKNHYN